MLRSTKSVPKFMSLPKAPARAVILAGGLGTRLRSVVSDTPKPMALIQDRPFLEYLLDYWIEQGISEFVLSIGYKAEQIQAHFGERYKSANLFYVIEREPLGTGGAVLQAVRTLNFTEDFLLLNGDTFYNVELIKFWAFHCKHKAEFTLALHRISNNDRYTSIRLDAEHRITALADKTQEQDALINAGVYLIHPRALTSVLDLEKSSLEAEILPKLHLHGFVTEGNFIDIGIPEAYEAAQIFF